MGFSDSYEQDEHWMRLAYDQAQQAAQEAEVPVGAVVVYQGQAVATGRNASVHSLDPSAHAEIQALRAAAVAVGNYRLSECTLYVTLEPCAMCAGAMLHARLKRVVFGAADPKTGAAGSVLNLFGEPRLNHQTQWQGGVLADACGALLSKFFHDRRQEIHMSASPLRDDALRTPDECFDGLPAYPWAPHYIHDLPSLAGLRMHYLDEQPVVQQAKNPRPLTWLCLHGNPAWSYLYRKMIPVFLEAGHRVVAPDLIGFGKSDKLKKESAHSFSWHRQVLLELIEQLDLHDVVLVVQDWGGLLGLTLPMEAPQRYHGLLVMNTTLATGDTPLSAGFLAWREMCARNPEFDVARLFARGNPHMGLDECAAYNAPFPDKGHRAALRAFPKMVPEFESSDGAAVSRLARDFWRERWRGRSLMAIGVQDPVLGVSTMQSLHSVLRGCPQPLMLQGAGHFVQEHGQALAGQAVRYFASPVAKP